VLIELMPGDPEVLGLVALMLLQDSRRDARADASGALVPLEEQDRSLWDRDQISAGRELLATAAARGRPVGRYLLQAALAAEHARTPTSPETDWNRIVVLYDRLAALDPSPVVELNRAAAVAMRDGPDAGLALIARIEGLDRYHLLHAARADLLRRAGRRAEAATAYRRALELAANRGERAYLNRRLAEVAH
jgi:RNA polymerase sigma-70 factor (ECF subfamily)